MHFIKWLACLSTSRREKALVVLDGTVVTSIQLVRDGLRSTDATGESKTILHQEAHLSSIIIHDATTAARLRALASTAATRVRITGTVWLNAPGRGGLSSSSKECGHSFTTDDDTNAVRIEETTAKGTRDRFIVTIEDSAVRTFEHGATWILQIRIAWQVILGDVETVEHLLRRAGDLVCQVINRKVAHSRKFNFWITGEVVDGHVEEVKERLGRAWQVVTGEVCSWKLNVRVARQILDRLIEVVKDLVRRTWDLVGKVADNVGEVEIGVALQVLGRHIEAP